MNCDQLREHYELYALGIAEEPEHGEIRAHLQRGCEACGAGMKRALETTALLGASAPAAQPSAQLRRRILASVGFERRGAGWFTVWAMAAALAAMFLFLVLVMQDRGKYVEEAVRSRAAFAILYGPSTVEASFGGSQPQPPPARQNIRNVVNPERPKADSRRPVSISGRWRGHACTAGHGRRVFDSRRRGDRGKRSRRRSAHHDPVDLGCSESLVALEVLHLALVLLCRSAGG